MKEKVFQIESPAFRCVVCDEEIAPATRYHSGVISIGDGFVRRDFCLTCWRAPDRRLSEAVARCVAEAIQASEAPEEAPEVDRSASTRARAGTPGEIETLETPGEIKSASAAEEADPVVADPVAAPRENGRPGGTDPGGTSPLYAHWTAQRPEAPDADAPRLRFDPVLVLPFFRKLHDEILVDRTRRISGSPPPGSGEAPAAISARESSATRALEEARPKRDLAFVLALLLIRKKVLSFESSVLVDGSEWLRLAVREEPETELWVENPELADSELERVRDELGRLLHMRV